MYKYLILFLLISKNVLSQSVINRGSAANTLKDERLMAGMNLYVPVFNDSTQANLSKGIDSSGAIYYDRSLKTLMYRQHSPKKWISLSVQSSLPNGLVYIDSIKATGSLEVTLYATISTPSIWRINGVLYQRNTDSVFTINAATTGFFRKDIIVANTLGKYQLIQGIQSATTAVPPATPINTVLVTTLDINGGTVLPPTPDLSGFVTLNTKQDINGKKTFNDTSFHTIVALRDLANDSYGSISLADGTFNNFNADGKNVLKLSVDAISFINSIDKYANINNSLLTNNRFYYLPNKSGTVALLDDIDTTSRPTGLMTLGKWQKDSTTTVNAINAKPNFGDIRDIVSDSLGGVNRLRAATSAGGVIQSNNGTTVAEWGLGGGSNLTVKGFAGYDINIASNYTSRSFVDKNYVDSSFVNYNDVATTLKNKTISGIYNNITNLDASSITSGQIPDARLSNSVVLANGNVTQTITGLKTWVNTSTTDPTISIFQSQHATLGTSLTISALDNASIAFSRSTRFPNIFVAAGGRISAFGSGSTLEIRSEANVTDAIGVRFNNNNSSFVGWLTQFQSFNTGRFGIRSDGSTIIGTASIPNNMLSVIGSASIGNNNTAPTNGLNVVGESIFSGVRFASTTITSNTTLTSTNYNIFVDASSNNVTVTLPTAVGAAGKVYVITRVDNTANTVTVNTTSSQLINGSTSYTGLNAQYKYVHFTSNNVQYYITSNN